MHIIENIIPLTVAVLMLVGIVAFVWDLCNPPP